MLTSMPLAKPTKWMETKLITAPPNIAPNPIPKYKADALKDRIIEAWLGFNEIK